MPIDASIYDQVKPPPSPLATLANIAQVREAQQNQQVTALKLRQEQQAMQEQQLLDAAYQKHVRPDGTIDYAGMANDVAAAGHGHLAPTLLESGQKVQKAMADAVKAQGEANDAQRNFAGSLGAGMQDLIDKGAPVDYVANYAKAHIDAGGRAGLMSPQDQQGMIQALSSGDPAAVPRLISAMRAASKQQSELDTSRLNANTTAAKAAATIPGDVADSVRKQQVTAGMKNGLTPEQQATTQLSAEQRAIAAGQLSVAQQRLGLEGQRLQNEVNNGGAPPPIKPGTLDYRMAQDIAYGKLTMADFVRLYGRAQKNAGLKTAIYDQARQLNPNFNPAEFEMGYKLASSPKVQQQLASMDNVVRAVPDLLSISDKAARTGVPLVNGIIEKGGIQLGGKTYSNFHTAQIAFADELSGALGYGSATDMSRDMGFSMTDPKLSPGQFRDAIQSVVVPFIQRKRQTLLDQMGVYGQPGNNPGATTGTPKVGDTKTFPNGSKGQWDGKGWVKIGG